MCEAGVTANDDGRRPSSSEFGSYLYVVPHPLLPQTVLTVVTLLCLCICICQCLRSVVVSIARFVSLFLISFNRCLSYSLSPRIRSLPQEMAHSHSLCVSLTCYLSHSLSLPLAVSLSHSFSLTLSLVLSFSHSYSLLVLSLSHSLSLSLVASFFRITVVCAHSSSLSLTPYFSPPSHHVAL